MKFLNFPAVLAAALLSAGVLIPFLAAPTAPRTGAFALELELASERPGLLQVYFPDASGALSEAASTRMPVVPGPALRSYRLPLPAGRFEFLRFDPGTQPGAVSMGALRIVTRGGRRVREIGFDAVKPLQQIATLAVRDGRLQVATTVDGTDAQLTISLTPPLELPSSWLDRVGARTVAVGLFVAILLVLVVLDRAPRLRERFARAGGALGARPMRAVAVVSAAAVIASAYPIIFLGQSHVSPNFGTPLLYDDVPTLPGVTSLITSSARGADVGATMWAHLPYSVVAHRAFAHGEFPLWNRYNALGTPLLGQGQSMIGDPLHLGVVAFRGAAWAWDAKYLIAKWLLALGLGLLVWHLTRHLPAALIVAAAAPFMGFFVYRISHAAYFSFCYAPWPLYAWARLAGASGRRGVTAWCAALVVSNLALLSSGTVKEAAMLLLAMNGTGACLLLAVESPWRARLARLAAALWSGGLLLLLTTPLWATFLHTLANAQTNYDLPSAYQIQPSLLLGAFDEAFFRLIMPAAAVFNPALNVLLLLGLLYFLVTLRAERPSRPVAALAWCALPPFALVFGLVPASWIVALPLLGRVQHIDNCFLCVLLILWSVLAGVGFARAARRLGTQAGPGDLKAVAAWLLAIVGLWLAFRQTVHRGAFGPGMTFSVLQQGQVLPVSGFVWGYLVSLLIASAGLFVLVRRCLLQRSITPAAALGLALATLALLWRNGLHADAVGFETYVVRPPVRADLQASSPAVTWLQAAQAKEPGRGFGLRDNFFMGWTAVYGLEAINGPDALMNPRYRELLAVSGTQRGISWDFTLPAEQLANVRPFFDAINVRYYVSRGRDDAALARVLKPVQRLDLDVWESPTAWPRAFFTHHVEVYDQPADLMARIKAGDGKPFAAVQRLEAGPVAALIGPAARRAVIAATDYVLTANSTEFSVDAPSPGIVALSETFWPGDFRCEVNGRKVPIVRVNHAFKGIVIDSPGHHRVVFRYVPRNFPRNLGLAGIGAGLLAVSLLAGLRRPAARSTAL